MGKYYMHIFLFAFIPPVRIAISENITKFSPSHLNNDITKLNSFLIYLLETGFHYGVWAGLKLTF